MLYHLPRISTLSNLGVQPLLGRMGVMRPFYIIIQFLPDWCPENQFKLEIGRF